jgi:hypothetical protein
MGFDPILVESRLARVVLDIGLENDEILAQEILGLSSGPAPPLSASA